MSSATTLIDVTLGQALREFRARNGLTQHQLAKRLRIPVRSLQAYEETGAMPQPKRRQRIVAFLEREAAKEAHSK